MSNTFPKKHLEILDRFSADDINRWKELSESNADYLWSEYSYYANERSKLKSKIRKSLVSVSDPYQFEGWFRVLTFKYNDNPLQRREAGFMGLGGGIILVKLIQ